LKLSELRADSFTLARDGDFTSLGLLGQRKKVKLTLVEGKREIAALEQDADVSCVVTDKGTSGSVPSRFGLCVADSPRAAFISIHNWLATDTEFYGRKTSCSVSRKARIHPTAVIASECVEIRDNCEIGPRAIVLERSILEEGVTVGPGSVVGSVTGDLFGDGISAGQAEPTGWVRIAKMVDIHGNCTLNCPVFGGETSIGEYTKFDNLVSVGQGACIGKRCLLVASCVLGDDVVIGDDVWVGPNATIARGVVVGNKAYVTLGSVVMDNVEPGKKVTGNFAIDHDKFLASLRRIR